LKSFPGNWVIKASFCQACICLKSFPLTQLFCKKKKPLYVYCQNCLFLELCNFVMTVYQKWLQETGHFMRPSGLFSRRHKVGNFIPASSKGLYFANCCCCSKILYPLVIVSDVGKDPFQSCATKLWLCSAILIALLEM
jgi:hypothetical protein